MRLESFILNFTFYYFTFRPACGSSDPWFPSKRGPYILVCDVSEPAQRLFQLFFFFYVSACITNLSHTWKTGWRCDVMCFSIRRPRLTPGQLLMHPSSLIACIVYSGIILQCLHILRRSPKDPCKKFTRIGNPRKNWNCPDKISLNTESKVWNILGICWHLILNGSQQIPNRINQK